MPILKLLKPPRKCDGENHQIDVEVASFLEYPVPDQGWEWLANPAENYVLRLYGTLEKLAENLAAWVDTGIRVISLGEPDVSGYDPDRDQITFHHCCEVVIPIIPNLTENPNLPAR